MANPATTVTDYCGVLTRSKLMLANEVRGVVDRWRTETRASDAEVDSFRKYLVARRLLTEYQAAMVQRGHADGFYIGGYVILDRIGKGQMAGVYKAVHNSGQTVALKVLASSKARNPHMLARFEREARLLTQLNHPNVVRAFQLGGGGDNGTTGVHYIVMEHLEGETLDDVLVRRKKLPAAEAARLLFQSLQGLQHLHDRRMVHRDLKPANLMLVPSVLTKSDTTLSSTVKIVDIGLGRELFDDDNASTQDIHLTAEGSLVGTPDYLAPEQARDARSSDIRADIYSLGCVLFTALAGRLPFIEKNVMATMVKHATEPPPPVAQFAPDTPPGLQAVLAKMLVKDPAGRYQTPSAAAQAVRPFMPADAADAVSTTVLPGFQEFLNSEDGDLPTYPPSILVDTKPAETVGLSSDPPRAPLPQKAPAPLAPVVPPAPAPRPAAVAAPPAASKPRASVAGPPSGKLKVGTGLAAALAGASTPRAGSSAAAPPSLKPASLPPRPSPLPPVAADGFDVELMPTSAALSDPADVLQARMADTPMRPLYDLDRRDFIMLALGAGGVLSAIATGLAVARFSGQKLRGGDEESAPGQP
ncbi:serine/threonine-protein kinase [Limnoglobus roseus]|uniref:Serine/threonine protein kinase n=1 Tax=Limnoglobus roseus TaxID=2598579 RepID=A0A5C1AAV2_9BACT|nr:serine/threonine-protein kinase [Limnoglobus roseus]QEL15347.1 serine/threonine protein kinase [Limnoglobus roseus]